MHNLKLGVEVGSGYHLIPKNREDLFSTFVELNFDRQKFRTTVKENDIDPAWNESFYFNISDPQDLPNMKLEVIVYSNNKTGRSKLPIGKVCITGKSFVPYSDAVHLYYPLDRPRIFSRARGELSLKVFITDETNLSSRVSSLSSSANSISQQVADHIPQVSSSDVKKEIRHNLRNFQEPKHEQQQLQSSYPTMDQTMFEHRATKPVPMYSGSSSQQQVEYALKQTGPILGAVRGTTNDLVEPMQFLYVRVVKARDLPSRDFTGSLDPYVEVRVGNYKGITRHFEKTQNPEWNNVFAFKKERMQSSVLEVVVRDKDTVRDDFVGTVRFDLHEIPIRVSPDSPLAPEWYRLENKKGEKKKNGELMLSVWVGTQADEAFPDAWHSDAASPIDISVPSSHVRSKVYHSPKLWFVRVTVIEAQDLVTDEKNRFPDVYVKAQIGTQVLKTRHIRSQTRNAMWNEELMFVAAEPFEEHLILFVENRVASSKDETLGVVVIPLSSVEKRADDRIVQSRWYNLQRSNGAEIEEAKRYKFATRVHLRVSLDGGYHVLDESAHCSSDFRPTAKQLWKQPVGVLELGILNANSLHPMKTRDGRGTCDTYCVAKYGHKWIRTRTIIDSLNPKYNEQYTWDVYDPATVLTVGVFDNGELSEKGSPHSRIGKARIRISTLETNRVYTHSYPLLVLHPSGVKKMGELSLAIRFSCTSMFTMMFQYSKPLLPKMHYVKPLSVTLQDFLGHQAVKILTAKLSRAEPPLRKEVVEYILDRDSHLWSMRRSKANFFRLMSVFNGLFCLVKWFEDVCTWKNRVTTVLVHILFVLLVCFPTLILPTSFLYMSVIGLWNYWYRPKFPPHINTRLSHADSTHPDELDEEFDTFPTSRSTELVRLRYDRLRSVAGRIQKVVGDVATQGERIQALLSWRDTRATAIFIVFCIVAAFVFYFTPFQLLTAVTGFYVMRHPRFRHRQPPPALNFFRRLPTKTDSML